MPKIFSKLASVFALGVVLTILFVSGSQASLSIIEYPLPDPSSKPTDIAPGADGNMWFTEQGHVRVGKIKSNGAIQEFSDGLTGNTLNGIHLGADHRMWFAEIFGNKIGSVTRKGTITESGGFSSAYFVTPGIDGNLWITDNGANAIVKRTPDGMLTSYPIPTEDSGVFGITAGPDGNLWFTEQYTSQIGKIELNGQITEYSDGISANSEPYLITAGPDGNVWFTEKSGNRIGRITPSGKIKEFRKGISKQSSPVGIVAGADGNLWFTEFDKNRIGKITPKGKVTEYPVPTAASGPNVINTDLHGNLWFTEYKGNAIGTIEQCQGELGAPNPIAPRHGLELNVTQPVFMWLPGMCATSYTITIKKNAPSAPDDLIKSDLKALLFQPKPLKKGMLYYWKVSACQAGKCVGSDWNTFRIAND